MNEGRVITNSPQVAFLKFTTNVTIPLYFPNHVSYYYISRLVSPKTFIVEDDSINLPTKKSFVNSKWIKLEYVGTLR